MPWMRISRRARRDFTAAPLKVRSKAETFTSRES